MTTQGTSPLPPRIETPNPARAIETQTVLLSLAMLAWGEARGEIFAGKEGVLWTVENRVKLAPHYGRDARAVLFRKAQYTCFSKTDVNRAKLLRPLEHGTADEWHDSFIAAHRVWLGLAHDATQGATHYHASSLYPRNLPKWALAINVHRTVTIGRHMFYREEWPAEPSLKAA